MGGYGAIDSGGDDCDYGNVCSEENLAVRILVILVVVVMEVVTVVIIVDMMLVR
ncbi:hypothetical protein DPMN_134312 [Dreissena polymorpha]|uniref:Transmembrane protein n=1 Tax=Dreissena polymorpha TaxID=45954 RepID=A0A9D4JFP4_DREPO|nr:hypothetical protein DPMN_134312 [Dreissena polymorpha]